MATGPHTLGSGPKQPGRAGQDDGSYFDGEGQDPFKDRAADADSREAEAVVDDLISEFTGSDSSATARGPETSLPAPGAPTGRAAAPQESAGNPEGTAGASGTTRGSASRAPGAGRMG